MKKKDERLKKRISHRPMFVPETMVMDTIVNTPLHPVTGTKQLHKQEIEETKRVRKGWHMYWRALIQDKRGNIYLREVIG